MTHNNRIFWIDQTRAIGIILVAFCHIYFQHTRTYIYSFLIPLFFIISGICYQQKKEETFHKFLIRKIKGLLYPYFLWNLILFLFWAIFDSDNHSIIKGFIGIFYGICDHEYLDWGMMMWFIPCLFCAEIIYKFIDYKAKHKTLIILIITLIAAIYNTYIRIKLPWSINISLFMIFFFHIGVISFKHINRFATKQIVLIIPILIAIYITSSKINGEIYSELGIFKNPILYIISSLSGTYMFIFLFKTIRINILKLVGANTLIIMILHLRTYTIIKAFELYILKHNYSENILSALIYVTVAIAILTPISLLIRKKIQFLIHPTLKI